MERFAVVRQLWLLLLKDMILLWRNKLWTLFELVVPVILTFPILFFLFQTGEKKLNLPLVTVQKHNVFDIEFEYQPSNWSLWKDTWCSKTSIIIAFTSSETDKPAAEQLMKNHKFQSRDGNRFDIQTVWFDHFSELLETMKNRTTYKSSMNGDVCNQSQASFEYGIEFEKITNESLSYTIIMKRPSISMARFQHTWEFPFSAAEREKISTEVPFYEKSGFAYVQFLIDRKYIEYVRKLVEQNGTDLSAIQKLSVIRIQPFHLLEKNYTVLGRVLTEMLPVVWGVLGFLAVIHTARDVASERREIKPFLQVMGLSRTTFYLSHTIFNWLKVSVIFLTFAIPLWFQIKVVSFSLYLVFVLLYGLSAIAVAVLVASMFKTTNSVIKVIMVVWLLSIVGGIFGEVHPQHILICFLLCLNVNHALHYAALSLRDHIERANQKDLSWSSGKLLSWSSMFHDGSYRFCFGYAILMLLFDIMWMWGMALVFDWLLGETGPKFPTIIKRKKAVVSESDDSGITAEYIEDETVQAVKNIQIRNLMKEWSTGELAVKDLSLDCNEGQVTVLLGHNGAGKSTTFSMVSGSVNPTSGNIYICGESMTENRAACCTQIGYCPQVNTIFPHLTVLEHLRLIHGLKRASGDWRSEACELTEKLKLASQNDTLAKNLTHGMKRKLCVCVALMGGSKVVLFDEPTAGMDLEARRDVAEVIEMVKSKRTILLTTHYMDEAELLGDKVVIMFKGSIFCMGSPEFLKKKFGTGYVLTFFLGEKNSDTSVMRQQSNIEGIMGIVKYKSPDAILGKQSGNQIMVLMPQSEQLNRFSDMFEVLENQSEKLNVKSFGMSLNTLEQVFIRVGELMSKMGRSDIAEEAYKNCVAELVENQKEPRRKSLSLWVNQLNAMMMKKFWYLKVNWSILITQFLVPLCGIVFVAYLQYRPLYISADGDLEVSISSFKQGRVFLWNTSYTMNFLSLFRDIIQKEPDRKLIIQRNDTSILSAMSAEPLEYPAIAMGIKIHPKGQSVLLFSRFADSSLPAVINAHDTAFLRQIVKNGEISTGAYFFEGPKKDPFTLETFSNEQNFLFAMHLLTPFMFSLLTSAFVIFLVEERSTHFSFQQRLTGVSAGVFWLGNAMFDFFFYFFVCSVFLIVFVALEWLEGYELWLLGVWLLYFFTVFPFICIVALSSFSWSKANVILTLWQMMACLATWELHRERLGNRYLQIIMCIAFPSISLTNAVTYLGIVSSETLMRQQTRSIVYYEEQYCYCLVWMVVSAFIGLIICFLLHFERVKGLCQIRRCCKSKPKSENKNSVNSDVEREKDVVAKWNKQSSVQEYSVIFQNLTKDYPQIRAVDELSLALKRKECFGLLGRNGAGKSTTLEILTRQISATSGKVDVFDPNANGPPCIGYCPQTTSLMQDYTGRQILWMMATLHGFTQPSDKAVLVLRCIGMEGHGDKVVKFYTGGQKRRLSVGVCLLAPTSILVLDEPTAGVDPVARRDVWSVLAGVREKSSASILLTSHSMEECEAMCSRIGIMKNGALAAIGSAQQLKSKYGRDFQLSMLAKSLDHRQQLIREVDQMGEQVVLRTKTTSQNLRIKWKITKTRHHRWSALWRKVEDIAEKAGALEFSLSQPTLEEVFLRTASDFDESEKELETSSNASAPNSSSTAPKKVSSNTKT